MQGYCIDELTPFFGDYIFINDYDSVHTATARMLPLLPGQCMLILDKPWLAVLEGPVWVDNLYLKIAPAGARFWLRLPLIFTPSPRAAAVTRSEVLQAPKVHVTNVTFEADPRVDVTGVSAAYPETAVYVDGVYHMYLCLNSTQLKRRFHSAAKLPACVHVRT